MVTSISQTSQSTAGTRVVNMAAPFTRVYRPLWRIITTTTSNGGVRNVSYTRQQWSAQNVKTAGAAEALWALHGAVCVQRLPVVSQDRSPIEEKFMELMQQVRKNQYCTWNYYYCHIIIITLNTPCSYHNVLDVVQWWLFYVCMYIFSSFPNFSMLYFEAECVYIF